MKKSRPKNDKFIDFLSIIIDKFMKFQFRNTGYSMVFDPQNTLTGIIDKSADLTGS